MIVRKEPQGELLLIAQTDHSRLAGLFAAHWGNGSFATPTPFESVARAAHFHDFGYLRYETAPVYDAATGQTPNFRDVPTDAGRLEEYQWNVDWLNGPDPYASHLVSMHRTGLWRGRYDAIAHPPHGVRAQPPQVDAFIERNEARREQEATAHGWDPHEVRVNYRLLQVWDLLSLYFACGEPYAEYIEPVPTGYRDRDGEGVRITLTPLGGRTVAFDPYPFDAQPLHIQLVTRPLGHASFPDQEAFRRAYYQAPIAVREFELVSAKHARGRTVAAAGASR